MLVIIDNGPLQREAWAEFHAARKRHDKTARDLHRHEQVDQPAYETWVHQTFPVLVSTLRDLHEEVFRKARQVEVVQAMADWTGRSPRKLWHEQKEAEANPGAFDDPGDDEDAGVPGPRDGKRRKGETDEADDFFEDEAQAGRRGHPRSRRSGGPDYEPPPAAKVTVEAKAIYRRLVQRLHPDRGGEWTTARKRLWHEVQQAWAAGDADWLARLEVESEDANEVLGPGSALSRLRRAIEELHAARRDTERKLRGYRGSLPWRFTLAEKKRDALRQRIEANFKHDITFLRRQLTHLDATIAAWEAKPTRRRAPRRQDFFWDEEQPW